MRFGAPGVFARFSSIFRFLPVGSLWSTKSQGRSGNARGVMATMPLGCTSIRQSRRAGASRSSATPLVPAVASLFVARSSVRTGER